MAGQVSVALRRIIRLLAEAGAGPENIVRLTWYLTSRSEYEVAGGGDRRGLARNVWKEFSALDATLYRWAYGARAKVEIEVTAFVPGA